MYEIWYKSPFFSNYLVTYSISFRDALKIVEQDEYGIKIVFKHGLLEGFTLQKGTFTYLLNKLLN